jgi:hypothetical protein
MTRIDKTNAQIAKLKAAAEVKPDSTIYAYQFKQ